MGRLEIDVIERGQELCLTGRLDAGSTHVARAALQREADAGEGDLVLRLRGLEIWDGAGLGVLVGLSHRAQRAGRRLVLVDVGPREVRLLRVARLTWTGTVVPADSALTARRLERPYRTFGALARS